MAREIDFATAQWIRGSDSPDPNGPTDVPYTPYDRDWCDRSLIEVIGETARRLPAQIAIDDGAIRLTYSQLFAMSCRLSHAIVRAELPPGPIGIKLSYDALHPVGVLGCLAAGRPCLLMSRDNPPDYNRRLIEASGLQALLVNVADARDGSAQGGPRLIPIEPVLMTGGDFDEQPAGRLGPDEPAFIVSTSGSTGVPKLIARSQRRLQLGTSSNINIGHFNENDRFLNLGAPATGAAVSRNFLPLLIGGRLLIVDIPRAGMGGILRVLRDQRITILRSTVSLMKAVSQLDDARAHLASLRVVWVGGEMLLQKDLAQIRAVLPPGCRLGYSLNMTETAVARWFVPETDDHDPIRVAVGYLQPETEVLLLDDEGRPCAPGEIGELIVRSRRVALGEWRDGHVMPDRFLRDPMDPSKRIYRTGDLARICPDGVMVVHGRKDRMIKIRGQRVEPAIVETAIREVAGVADAAVAAKQTNGDVRIYGFVVPEPQAVGDLLADVNNALKTALPSYMRPSDILIVKSLPSNTGGKVDIKALLDLICADDNAAAQNMFEASPRAAVVSGFDFSTAQWIRSSGSPDPNGPTDVPYTPYDTSWFDRPLIEVIGETARRLPAQIAIDDGAIRLTYSQLYAMACRLSHAISRAELPPGPIGIGLLDGAYYVVAMLGCLAAGRPCLLLSQDNPPEYNHRLIEASSIQALLVNAVKGRDMAAAGGPRLIPIEPILTSIETLEGGPAGRLGPDEPAFILSTAGSTGLPRLIVRTQRALQRRISNTVHVGHFSENDRILTLGAPAVGAAVSRRFLPLLIGATLYLVDVPRAGMGGIIRVLRDHPITSMRTTSSLIKALAQLEDARTHLANLRLIWGGGEMLLQKDLAQIRALLPSGCLFGYGLGSTETGVTRWFVPEKDDHDPVRVAVGYLLPGTEALVLDDEGRPCPIGEVGELIVRSHSVAMGEWVNGRLIVDRFQHDTTDPAKRIYRTGDMVRICPDGVMVVHGRKDRMIKIRGQRVEPAVVETAIRNVAGVADAAVAAQQSDGDVRIYGFVVPSAQAGGDLITGVNNELKSALPSYMRPSDILIVKSLPINVGGKVDIKALLALIPSDDSAAAPALASSPHSSHDPASGRARDMVASAWRTAFRKEPKDSSLSFEAAGGDSLQFMQIIFRLEQLGGKSLPLDAFDVSMTQEDMARRLDFLLLGGGVEPRRQGKQVFLLPGVGGDEPRLLQFRLGCAPELSIVSLDYGDWTQWVEPGFGFDTIVDRLVARIQELAPTGPLSLAGYSLGGRAALVVAAKLHKAGREIENLLILDSEAIVPHREAKTAEAALDAPPLSLRQEFLEWRRARRRGEGAFALALIGTRRLVSPRWAPLLRWVARHRRTVLPGRIDFYLSFHIYRSYMVQLASDWQNRLPEIPRLPVPITLFLARDQGKTAEREAGWKEHSPNVSVVSVDGDHFTMFDPPHLADLCARFKAACAVKAAREFVAS